MNKEQWRQQLRERLKNIGEEQRREKSSMACRRLIATPQFSDACQKVIMVFLSLPEEVDTSELITRAWQLGKTIAVPKILWQQKCMTAVVIDSLETEFSTNTTGLRNPVDGRPIAVEKIDLVVAPALGFDREGNRLGRGGAYYDRFFADENLRADKCGMAFAEQLIDNVPVTKTDVAVDLLVTDEEVIYINQVKHSADRY